MSRITLLRHGVTIAGARYCGSTDSPLSDEGWRQMWCAVENKTWSRIVSSPLMRCVAFARALASERGIPCEIDERWREMHFGDWENRSAEEIFERTPQALEHFWRDPVANPPPHAEPLPALRSRVLQAWKDLGDTSRDDNVLVISHGGPIRILLAERDRLLPTQLLEIEVAHAQLIEIEARPTCAHS